MFTYFCNIYFFLFVCINNTLAETIVCTGSGSCGPCDISDELCDLQCLTTDRCKNYQLNGAGGTDSSLECTGTNSCKGAQFQCGTTSTCSINCHDGTSPCTNLQIYCQSAKECLLTCTGGADTCKGITVYKQSASSFQCFGPTASGFCGEPGIPASFTLLPTSNPTNIPTTFIPTYTPTTSLPTTNNPTTSIPTSNTPTTSAPTTNNPTTSIPTTLLPTLQPSLNPTTNIPSIIPSNVPTLNPTQMPITSIPTHIPTTNTPTTYIPTYTPTTYTPTTNAPTEGMIIVTNIPTNSSTYPDNHISTNYISTAAATNEFNVNDTSMGYVMYIVVAVGSLCFCVFILICFLLFIKRRNIKKHDKKEKIKPDIHTCMVNSISNNDTCIDKNTSNKIINDALLIDDNITAGGTNNDQAIQVELEGDGETSQVVEMINFDDTHSDDVDDDVLLDINNDNINITPMGPDPDNDNNIDNNMEGTDDDNDVLLSINDDNINITPMGPAPDDHDDDNIDNLINDGTDEDVLNDINNYTTPMGNNDDQFIINDDENSDDDNNIGIFSGDTTKGFVDSNNITNGLIQSDEFIIHNNDNDVTYTTKNEDNIDNLMDDMV